MQKYKNMMERRKKGLRINEKRMRKRFFYLLYLLFWESKIE